MRSLPKQADNFFLFERDFKKLIYYPVVRMLAHNLLHSMTEDQAVTVPFEIILPIILLAFLSALGVLKIVAF